MTLVYCHVPTLEIYLNNFETWLTENTTSKFDIIWSARPLVCYAVNFTNDTDLFLLQCKFPSIKIEYDLLKETIHC